MLGNFLMPRIVQWERQIGRRLPLRNLFVFFTVVENGSMAKAAAQLGVSTPSVSEIIAGLEHAVGARLLDRSPQGVCITPYGQALLKRSKAAFDELRQGVKDIEFLSDPTSGELRVGCSASLAITPLPLIVEHFRQQYPRVIVRVDVLSSSATRYAGLRDRIYDLIVARLVMPPRVDDSANDLNTQYLFDDPAVVAAGAHTRWARRRKIDLAELADEPWILPAPGIWNYQIIAEAFQARGLDIPKASLVTISWPLASHFLASGSFITGCARSLVRHAGLKVLAVNLPHRPWPVMIMTIKNRTLSPLVERFIASAREATKSIGGKTSH